MKIAVILLLELFVLLCQSAVITNPQQLGDSSKPNVDRRTIIRRASPAGSSSTSSLGTISVEGDDSTRSYYLKLRPGEVSGPPDRLYDWDESCTDSTQRQKISDAYNMAVKLAKDSEAKLKTLADGLPKRPANKEQPVNQNWIAEHDPAYAMTYSDNSSNNLILRHGHLVTPRCSLP